MRRVAFLVATMVILVSVIASGPLVPSAGAITTVTVSIKNLSFNPSTITVIIGINNTVVWTNNDSVTHTVTANDLSFNQQLSPGEKFTHTFSVPGSFSYHCSIHTFMTGKVVVLSFPLSPRIKTTLSHLGILAGQSVSDTSALSGGFHAGGTVKYEFFAGSACLGAPTLVNQVAVTSNKVPPSASHTFSVAKSYSWNALYSGDSENKPAKSPCEPMTVLPSSTPPTRTTVTCSKTSVTLGAKITCTATTKGSTSLSGSVTWTKASGGGSVKFSPTVCTLSSGKCSTTVTATAKGSITIKATYAGDAHHPWSSGVISRTIT